MRASDRAYATLREEIVDGLLAPGTVLGEVEQSARLGLSRTPLREALSRLVSDGLAAPSRGRGLLVTAVSLEGEIKVVTDDGGNVQEWRVNLRISFVVE